MANPQRWLPGTALGGFFDRNSHLDRAREVDRLLSNLHLGTGHEVPMSSILDLYAHWGHPLDDVEASYLGSALHSAEHVDGPILQCGASLTTLILGKLCDGLAYRAKPIICLEENPHWANVIRSWLTQYQIHSVQVLTAVPQLHSGSVWYGIDQRKLPHNIALALCQGNKSQATSMISLIIRCSAQLAPGVTLLGQQQRDPVELQFLERWAKRHDMRCMTLDKASGFIKVIPTTAVESGYRVKSL